MSFGNELRVPAAQYVERRNANQQPPSRPQHARKFPERVLVFPFRNMRKDIEGSHHLKTVSGKRKRRDGSREGAFETLFPAIPDRKARKVHTIHSKILF